MSVYSNWKYFFDSFWKFVSRNSYPIVLVLAEFNLQMQQNSD